MSQLEDYFDSIRFAPPNPRKGPLSSLDTDLHEAVETADVSAILKCLEEGAEVILNMNAYGAL